MIREDMTAAKGLWMLLYLARTMIATQEDLCHVPIVEDGAETHTRLLDIELNDLRLHDLWHDY